MKADRAAAPPQETVIVLIARVAPAVVTSTARYARPVKHQTEDFLPASGEVFIFPSLSHSATDLLIFWIDWTFMRCLCGCLLSR